MGKEYKIKRGICRLFGWLLGKSQKGNQKRGRGDHRKFGGATELNVRGKRTRIKHIEGKGFLLFGGGGKMNQKGFHGKILGWLFGQEIGHFMAENDEAIFQIFYYNIWEFV